MGLQQWLGNTGHHTPANEPQWLYPRTSGYDRRERLQRETFQGTVRTLVASQCLHADPAVLLRTLGS